MKTEPVSYWIREIVNYLNRTGCKVSEIRKEAEDSCRVGGEVEDYLSDIKKIFVEKFRQDPSLMGTANPEVVWQSMEGTLRRDVEKLLGKAATAVATEAEIGNYLPEEEEVRRDFMEHLKRMFMHFIIGDPRHKHENPQKIWENFKKDIDVAIKKLRA
jgi:DNA replication initiation complex subunit (GINS family)